MQLFLQLTPCRDFIREKILYKDPQEGYYYLILHQSQHTIAEFNQVIHLINSYLQSKKYVTGTQAYYEEHFQKIIIGNALQQLGEIA